RRLVADGFVVTAVDDRPTEEIRIRAAQAGATLVEAPTPSDLTRLSMEADLVLASPGVHPSHPIFSSGAEVVGEIELAAGRATAPMVAITGTSGKTTVTTLVAAMLEASGIRAIAAGNIGLPLIEAIERDCDVLVVEVSSFQLSLTRRFHPHVAVWLNAAENHLDWHLDMDDYLAAKAKVWANLGPGETIVANAEDPVVMASATTSATASALRLITFGLDQGDYAVSDGHIRDPEGRPIVAVAQLPRRRPHDLANALAGLAAAQAAGASMAASVDVLVNFEGLPHRLESLGQWGGVEFFNDSKATTPAAVAGALSGFSSVVLIAGGRNKGVSLVPMAQNPARIRAVVAIGEAAGEVEKAFAGTSPVVTATSMDDAVEQAAGLARPGDAVLLSPGCASYDWYRSYEERGDDFKRAVANLGQATKEEQ
ncbi:MAG: UDP-N-acetylmuramoyl-L-alanine--D-glutamate ligase, partial [Acidimicrobiales bacterium]